MTRLFPTALFLSLLAVLAAPVSRAASDSPLKLADLAWDEGDYPSALAGYLKILDSPQGDAALEAIALRTGELYRTIEVTSDGALPRFSPDGRHFTYENGVGMRRVVRLLATAAPAQPLVELPGWDAAFSPDGVALVYLKMPESADITAAQAAVDTATAADRTQKTAALTSLLNAGARVALRDIASGRETVLETGAIAKTSLFVSTGNVVIFAGLPAGATVAQLYAVGDGRPVTALTSDETVKVPLAINNGGTALLFTVRPPGAGRGGRGGAGAGAAAGAGGGAAAAPAATPAATLAAAPAAGPGSGPGPASGRGGGGAAVPAVFGVMSLPDGKVRTVDGSSPSFSGDGRTIVYIGRAGAENSVMAAATADPGSASVVRKGPERVEAPAASPDGSRVAYQLMLRDDWEIYTAARDGTAETRITRDIQHDLLPQLPLTGSRRHRRRRTAPPPLVPQRPRRRHADTPLPQQHRAHDRAGVRVGAEQRRHQAPDRRRARRRHGLDRARRLSDGPHAARSRAPTSARASPPASPPRKRCAPTASVLYAAIADAVRSVVAKASVPRIYAYEKALYDFDSKHISRPGNKLASEYLFDTYTSFGYAPELQWFDRQQRARRQDRQRRRDAARHGEPGADLRRQQPLRLGRDRPWRRRRFVGHGGAARDGAAAGEAPAAGDDHLRVVHGRRGRACSAAASSCAARSPTSWRSSAR